MKYLPWLFYSACNWILITLLADKSVIVFGSSRKTFNWIENKSFFAFFRETKFLMVIFHLPWEVKLDSIFFCSFLGRQEKSPNVIRAKDKCPNLPISLLDKLENLNNPP